MTQGGRRDTMKALSIRQPWAWLIVQGVKDVENRTWRTNFRGRFLVHAGKGFDEEGFRRIWATGELRAVLPASFPRRPDAFERGGIVGEAVLADCVNAHPSRWFSGPLAFVLTEQRPLPFVECRGMLNFFTVPDKVVAAIDGARIKG
jgi:hypothetical protein